jgi:hypothetical protein
MELVPQEVDEVFFAFPANVIDVLIPKEEEIPEEFRDNWHRDSHYWCKIVNDWFAGALGEDFGLYPKEGIDAQKAGRHCNAALRSFQPSHEHKIAGVAYLMSLWFKTPEERAAANEEDMG